jgi:hypothetical protein
LPRVILEATLWGVRPIFRPFKSTLEEALADLGIPVGRDSRAGVRRIDAAADLCTESAAEGAAILAGVAALTPLRGKVVSYRAGQSFESVLLKSPGGRTLGRVYDKGVESGGAPRGRLIRPEAQLRFTKETRRDPEHLDGFAVREFFRGRMRPLWEAAQGVRLGGLIALRERLEAAVGSGQLAPSRARSLAGYLLLKPTGVAQGAARTEYELARECRELGLSLSPVEREDREIDLGAVLEECAEAEGWE